MSDAPSGLVPQPQAGLLDPSMQTFGQRPGPWPPVPGLMRPVGQGPSIQQVMLNLQPAQPTPYESAEDADNSLPPQLRAYAAGLRPTVKPSEVAWQQEIIYDRL